MSRHLMRLDERIVFDAAGSAEVTKNQSESSQAPAQDSAASGQAAQETGAAATAQAGAAGEPRVLAVSSAVAQSEALASAAASGVVVVAYDAKADGAPEILTRISEALHGEKAKSIAFAAHDLGAGAFDLGGGYAVSFSTLASNPELQAFWSQVGELLTQDGRIDLLACDLAQTSEGQALTGLIQDLSGHAVAASTDATGSAQAGGNWVLETAGVDAAATYFDAGKLADFQGTLAASSLLADVNAQGATFSRFTEVNGTLFFIANDKVNGAELWKSDGTQAGTMLVKDINPGFADSSLSNLLNVNGTLFFTANNGANGVELWKSDGTEAGTVLVKDIYAGATSSSPGYLAAVNGTLFFSANSSGKGIELWKSDGTDAGTVLVKDIYTGSTSASPTSLTNVDGVLYFAANSSGKGIELWKSDGTDAGTVLVKDIYSGTSSSSPANLTAVGATLFFSATNGTNGIELWKSDGTDAGTALVKDIVAGTGTSSLSQFRAVGSRLLFTATDGTSGVELWSSDGTTAGTALVKDIYAGATASSPTNLTVLGSTLYFTANNGTNGVELWSSDGTTTGTALVKDLYSGTTASSPSSLAVMDGKLYFCATTAATGYELWTSDGTSTGTVLVKDIYAGTGNSSPALLTTVGDKLFFTAYTTNLATELWVSDGTTAGTAMGASIAGGRGSSNPALLTDVGGVAFFTAFDPDHGTELWKTDGTTTSLVRDIRTGTASSGIANLLSAGDWLYFTANDGTSGVELWRSDGTEAGTAMVKDIYAGSTASTPTSLTLVNGVLYFAANSSGKGIELWKSDGTSDGTVLVKDIRSGSGSSSPAALANVNGVLFFSATNGSTGAELWKSDGTAAGTVLVANIAPGATASSPTSLTVLDGYVYFAANNTTNGVELWRSDGAAAGTTMVKDLNAGSGSSSPANLKVLGATLFFTATNGTSGVELWKTDGTDAGTVLVKDIYAGTSASTPANLTVYNSALYFTATNGTNGVELWRTDGTAEGTVLVKDITSGSGSSSPLFLKEYNGLLYFAATASGYGSELWKTDGASAGTVLVKDIYAGSTSSTPQYLTVSGGKLLFAATNPLSGRELWQYAPGNEGLPVLGGTFSTLTVTDKATTTKPFASVTITDPDDAPIQTLTVTVALDEAAKGAFTTLAGFTSMGGGVYAFSGTATAAQTAIRALVFRPTENRLNPGLSDTTRFTVSVSDGYGTVTNQSTTVTATSTNDAPVLGGAVANQAVNDNASVSPFAAFTVTDADAAQTLTLTVRLDTAAKGSFTTLNGFTSLGGGQYRFVGPAAAAQAAIRGLVFSPTPNRMALGATETTTFTVTVSDGVASTVTNAATTTRTTSVNDLPALGGSAGLQATTDTSTISPFTACTVTDPDAPAQTLTLTVTLDDAAKGTFSSFAGFTALGGGAWRITGPAATVQSALRALVFRPAANRVDPGTAETTAFTVQISDGVGTTTNASVQVAAFSVNDPTAIGGADATQATTDKVSLSPFASFTVADPDAQTLSVTVTPDDAVKGSFAPLAGVTANPDGSLAFSGNAAQVQALLRALVFSPAENRLTPGQTEAATFTVAVSDGTTTWTNSATAVAVTSVNDPTVLGGADGGLSTTDKLSLSPFAAFTVADPDAQTLSVTVTPDDAVKGSFAPLAGVTANPDGSLALSGSAAQVQALLRALEFRPAENRLAPGQTEAATFTVAVSDGTFTWTDAVTAVAVTSVNDAPVVAAGTAIELPAITDGDGGTSPARVRDLLNGLVRDPDTLAQAGMAVTAADASAGQWSYSLDNGRTWLGIGTVSPAQALLLGPSALVRFESPDGFSGQPSLGFRAWDGTAGIQGGRLDARTQTATGPVSQTLAQLGVLVRERPAAPEPPRTVPLAPVVPPTVTTLRSATPDGGSQGFSSLGGFSVLSLFSPLGGQSPFSSSGSGGTGNPLAGSGQSPLGGGGGPGTALGAGGLGGPGIGMGTGIGGGMGFGPTGSSGGEGGGTGFSRPPAGDQPSGGTGGGEAPQGAAPGGPGSQGGEGQSDTAPQAQDSQPREAGEASRPQESSEDQARRDDTDPRDGSLALSAAMLRNLIRELADSGQDSGHLLQVLAVVEAPRA